MKRFLTAVSLAAGMSAAVSAAPGITLKAPQVTSWTQSGHTADQTTLNSLNAQLQTAFDTIASDLNTTYNNFDNLGGLNDLAKGFANANMAAFDNASLLGYQNYDLFAVSVGFNTGIAVPSLNPTGAAGVVNQVLSKGDVYVGLATGGIAAQAGINAGFLVPNLYLTGRVGFIPNVALGNAITAQQGMFGLGANYRLVKAWDFGFGLVKWRGISVGSGFVYNANASVGDQSADVGNITFDDGAGHSNTVDVTANTQNSKAKLTITSTSIVIPLDIMTSVQLLWFLNLGLGAGADLNFASTKIGLGASSELGVTGTGADNITTKNGSASLNVNESAGKGDVFVPRLAASIGVDLTIVKLDVPVSYYPTTKAFALGITGGLVW